VNHKQLPELYACWSHLPKKPKDVSGRPYHPESNGGVEAVNKTIMALVYVIFRQNRMSLNNVTLEEFKAIVLRATNIIIQ
jgi:hypothetical protein